MIIYLIWFIRLNKPWFKLPSYLQTWLQNFFILLCVNSSSHQWLILLILSFIKSAAFFGSKKIILHLIRSSKIFLYSFLTSKNFLFVTKITGTFKANNSKKPVEFVVSILSLYSLENSKPLFFKSVWIKWNNKL